MTALKSKVAIEEKIDPALLTSLMRNYSNAAEAIFELIDNSVDERLPGQKLIIDIRVTTGGNMKTLTIKDRGGSGMGFSELKKFFEWGASGKIGKLGRYGQGGKAAMGYLGKSWTIVSSRVGEPHQYEIYEPDWRNRKTGLRTYAPKRTTTPRLKSQGFVQFEINYLSRAISQKKLIEKIQETYNMLLTAGDLGVEVNGISVEPKVYDLVERQAVSINLGKDTDGSDRTAYGWVGILKSGAGLRGGIRTCVLGRLINSEEYFDHPDYKKKASLGQLIGEVSADHLPLGLNKTNFDRDDSRWSEFSQRMYEVLTPLVKKLLEEKEEVVTKNEKERIKKVGKTFNEFLKDVENRSSEPDDGLSRGQKKPEHISGVEDKAKEQESEEGGGREQYVPRTPPPVGAIGTRKRTTFKKGYDYDIRVSDPSVRSHVTQHNGREIVIVNKLFPMYKERKGDDLYLYETLIQEVNKPKDANEELDCRSYCDTVNMMLTQLHKFLIKKA